MITNLNQAKDWFIAKYLYRSFYFCYKLYPFCEIIFQQKRHTWQQLPCGH
jgi:hypothetical protein